MKAKETSSKSKTAKKPCKCKHPQQDKMYGKQVRLMNLAGTKERSFYRCTVCSEKTYV